MESLPLELLVRVLGLAASGSDGEGALLLRVVPLVCRRWRDAARDPRCWAGVDVVMRPHYWPRRQDAANRDYLLLARAHSIRNLQFRSSQDSPGTNARRKDNPSSMLAALRANRAVVRNVSMHGYIWEIMCRNSRDAFLRLLWRSRESLRCVEVPVDGDAARTPLPRWDLDCIEKPRPPSPCASCDSPGLRLYLLEVLAEMPLLEELEMLVDIDTSPRYADEMAAMATTRLRRLQVDAAHSVPSWFQDPFPEALVEMLEDLLRCGATTLEDVTVSGWWPLPESTLRLLAACPRLARLAAAPACLAEAAGGLESVKELVLEVCVDPEEDQFRLRGARDEADSKVTEMVRTAMDQCRQRALPCLRAVTVDIVFGNWDDLEAKELDECRKLVTALSAHKPSVSLELTVNGDSELSS